MVISPSMLDGLSFDTATGTISGTPAQLLDRTMFTITATNTGGSATNLPSISPSMMKFQQLSYTRDDLTMVNNTVSVDLPLTPTVWCW